MKNIYYFDLPPYNPKLKEWDQMSRILKLIVGMILKGNKGRGPLSLISRCTPPSLIPRNETPTISIKRPCIPPPPYKRRPEHVYISRASPSELWDWKDGTDTCRLCRRNDCSDWHGRSLVLPCLLLLPPSDWLPPTSTPSTSTGDKGPLGYTSKLEALYLPVCQKGWIYHVPSLQLKKKMELLLSLHFCCSFIHFRTNTIPCSNLQQNHA